MKRSGEAGFTIVEVLIALATAGLIFIIIFNAIPGLVRNSHNNQRKQDVTAVLGAISQYELRNSGNLPSSYTVLTGAPGAPTFGEGVIKLSYYDATNITVSPQTPTAFGSTNSYSSIPGGGGPDSIFITNFMVCDPSTQTANTTGAGYRDIVALYDIETSSGVAFKCQQL